MTQRLFSEIYMKSVYAQQTNPPNLHYFLVMLFFIHAAFNLFIFVILALLYFTLYQKNTLFIVNSYLIYTYLVDYLVSVAIVWMIMLVVVYTVQNKEYFRYRTEGLRAIRAVSSIIKYITLIVMTLPLGFIVM